MDLSFVIPIILIAAAIGIWIGYRQYLILQQVVIFESIMRAAFDRIIFLKMEVQGDMVLAYNVVNEEFICQGSNMDEIYQRFEQLYPDRKGIIVNSELPGVPNSGKEGTFNTR